MSLIRWLEEWYKSQCDGDWEHLFGVEIGTLDNVYLKELIIRRVLDVEDYNYTTTPTDDVSLIQYIGTNSQVRVPTIEEI